MNGEDFSSPDPHPWIIQNDKGLKNSYTAQTYTESYASIECLIFALKVQPDELGTVLTSYLRQP